MPTSDPIPVALTAEQWQVVQTALDTQYYEDEHRSPGGLSPTSRRQRRDETDERLAALVEIDREIASATGLDALLS